MKFKTQIFFAIFLFCAKFVFLQEQNKKNAADVRKKVVDAAKQYIGCAYQTGAIGPDKFDCSGLIYIVMKEAGAVQIPRTAKAIFANAKSIDANEAEIADLVFFKTTGTASISHVGLYIGQGQFIHAASDGANTGVIVSSLKEKYYANCFAGFGRILPIADNDSNSEQPFWEKPNSKIENSQTKKNSENSAPKKNKENLDKTSKKDERNSNLVIDVALFADWNFWLQEKFVLNLRGIAAEANLRYSAWKLEPGIGLAFRYNHGTRHFQIPIVLSILPSKYIKPYAGIVINFGNPKLPGSDQKIKGCFFPGIMGFSFQTPQIKTGRAGLCFVQDFEYTFFNSESGGSLDSKQSMNAGFVFSTGIRIILPIANFIKKTNAPT